MLETINQNMEGEPLKTMKDLTNFTVSDICRREAFAEDKKFDIADYLQKQCMTMMQWCIFEFFLEYFNDRLMSRNYLIDGHLHLKL